uniref:Ribosomal protein S11 n=1 Tax=Gracilariopsis andersonii TaxID=172979 RepID=E5Q3D1_9FLOR|nr:ribosomal protein S11 [Gracilariopsis andersonii]ADR03214.1 ribosomal protein S11 [Gracilariopsis andersonii]
MRRNFDFLHPLCGNIELFVIDKIFKVDCFRYFKTTFLFLSNPLSFKWIYWIFKLLRYAKIIFIEDTIVVNVIFFVPFVRFNPADVQKRTFPSVFVKVYNILLDVNIITNITDFKLFFYHIVIFNKLFLTALIIP